MKAHELARKLLEMEDVDVWIPKINTDRALSNVNKIEICSGREATKGAKCYDELSVVKAIVIE